LRRSSCGPSAPKRPLRSKDKIGVAVGKVVHRYKMGKHFLLEITEGGFTYRRDEARIRKEAALDGLYVIRTSVGKGEFAPVGAVRAYKDLALVGRAFRSVQQGTGSGLAMPHSPATGRPVLAVSAIDWRWSGED